VDTLSCVTNFVEASKLRPGMVIPCIAAGLSGWVGSVWRGSYQVSTTEPLFMKRVHYAMAHERDLPENIRVDPDGLDGLLAFNEAGHSHWSAKLRGKLSKSIPFVPAGHESLAPAPAPAAQALPTSSTSSSSSDPPRVILQSKFPTQSEVQIMAVTRVLGIDMTKVRDFLGA